jgi:hypothetical protein
MSYDERMGDGMIDKHEHHRTLQAEYSTKGGFIFILYCQQCFDATTMRLNVDELEHILNEYAQLKEDSEFLDALKAAGVDNWQGYDHAFDILREME